MLNNFFIFDIVLKTWKLSGIDMEFQPGFFILTTIWNLKQILFCVGTIYFTLVMVCILRLLKASWSVNSATAMLFKPTLVALKEVCELVGIFFLFVYLPLGMFSFWFFFTFPFQLFESRRPEGAGRLAEGAGGPDLLRHAELRPDGDPGGNFDQKENWRSRPRIQKVLRVCSAASFTY